MDLARQLGNTFLAAHPDDAARLLEGLPLAERAALLEASDTEAAARVVQSMVADQAAQTLATMDPAAGGAILSRQPVELATLLLRRSEEPARANLLGAMETGVSESIKRKLRYPEDTVGALMDPLVSALPSDLTAAEALDRLQRLKLPGGYYLYVVDRRDRLVGVTNLRELMQAEPTSPAASLMKTRVARLSASASRDDMAASRYWRHYHRLPVVDSHGTLVGVMRYETLHGAQEESSDAAQVRGGLDAVMALSELYWSGLAGVLTGLTETPAQVEPIGTTRGAKDRGK